MPARHRLLAVLVALMWGLNFIAIDASLAHFPPMFLVALRFALIAVPTVLLVPWPQVPVRWLVGYGLGFGTLQFLFLYWGMAAGMPAGLASLVLQMSGPFTVLLGATFLRERVSGRQLLGIVVAVGGLTLVGWQRAENASVVPLLLTLAGAFGWAIGNICNRQARPTSPLRLTLWMSVVPPVPMLALSLLVEGPQEIAESLSWDEPEAAGALLGLAYTVLVGTVLGSGIWTWLMTWHPAGVVAPFSMLVPVFGMTAAWVVLGETVTLGEGLGAVLVVVGVLLGSLRRRVRRRPPNPPLWVRFVARFVPESGAKQATKRTHNGELGWRGVTWSSPGVGCPVAGIARPWRMPVDEGHEIEVVVERLSGRFPELSRDEIRDQVLAELGRYAAADVRDFVPVLVENAVMDTLRATNDPVPIVPPEDPRLEDA